MVLVNYTTRELTAKLVYYGAGLCGKTTNLQYVFDNLLPKDRRGKMVSLATETDRTLFFDFLPLEIGTIRGLKTRLQLYTVPGQVHYNATRKIVLKGADGIVFVADSQVTAREANLEAYKNMKANLAEHGLDLAQVPHVFQFNKRDLPNVMPLDMMEADLNEHNVPFWEATAIQGIGVEDTLKSITKLVLKNLASRFQADVKDAAAAAPSAPSVAVPAAPAPVPAPAAAAPVPPPAAALPVTPPPAAAIPLPAPPVAAPLPLPSPAPLPAAGPPPFSQPAAAAPSAPLAGWPAPAAAAPMSPLELDMPGEDEGEVLEVGDEAIVLEDDFGAPPAPAPAFGSGAAASADPFAAPDMESAMLGMPPAMASDPFGGHAAPPQQAADLEAALVRGDTVLSSDFVAPSAEPAGAADLESQFLSGDTVLSSEPLGFEMPAPAPAAPAAAPPRPPAPTPPAPAPAAAPFAAQPAAGPPAFEESPFAAPAFGSDEIPLSGDLDLEAALLAGPPAAAPVQPAAAPVASAPPRAPAAPVAPAWGSVAPAAAPAPAVVTAEAPLPVAAAAEIETPLLALGRAARGQVVERVLRVPVEYDDGTGTRRTTLEVAIRFRID